MLRFLQWLLRQEGLLRALRPIFGRFAPFLPEHRRDPQTTWRGLRESGPIYRSRAFGTFLCSRYDDVLYVLRDPHFSTDRSQVPAMRLLDRFLRRDPDFAGLIGSNLLTIDGDHHRRLRGLVSKAFTPRRVEAPRGRFEENVDLLLDHVAESCEMEVVRDLAYPLPVFAIAELLGVPAEDRSRFRACG